MAPPARSNWQAAERVRWVRGLRPLHRRLLEELAWESSPAGLVSPGDEDALADRVEAHVTSMRNALHALIAAGHVERVRRGARGRPAVYRITPQVSDSAPAPADDVAVASGPTAVPNRVTPPRVRRGGAHRRPEYRQPPLLASLPGGRAPEAPADAPDSNAYRHGATPPNAPTGHRQHRRAAPRPRPTCARGGTVASPEKEALLAASPVASSSGEATDSEARPPAPTGEAMASSASPHDEAIGPNASPSSAAPSKELGLDLGLDPQPPSVTPNPTELDRLVAAAVNALPPPLRAAISPASRKTLTVAAAPLAGRWTPDELHHHLAGDLPRNVTNPGGLLHHKLAQLAAGPPPRRKRAPTQPDRPPQPADDEHTAELRAHAEATYRAHPERLAAVAAQMLATLRWTPFQVLLGTAVVESRSAPDELTTEEATPLQLVRAATEAADAGLEEQVRAVHAAAQALPLQSEPAD